MIPLAGAIGLGKKLIGGIGNFFKKRKAKRKARKEAKKFKSIEQVQPDERAHGSSDQPQVVPQNYNSNNSVDAASVSVAHSNETPQTVLVNSNIRPGGADYTMMRKEPEYKEIEGVTVTGVRKKKPKPTSDKKIWYIIGGGGLAFIVLIVAIFARKK